MTWIMCLLEQYYTDELHRLFIRERERDRERQ